MKPKVRLALTRVVVPLLLALLVGLAIAFGGNALPQWLANAAMRTGLGLENAVKLGVAGMVSAAACAVLFARLSPAIAWAVMLGMAFVGLAELSALLATPGGRVVPPGSWALPAIATGLGVAGCWALSATAPTPEQHAAQPPSRVTAWRVLVCLAIVGLSLAIAARLTVHPREEHTATGALFVDLDVDGWVGKTLPATGFAQRLPAITGYTLEGTKWIVFYQPSCGRCHEVFNVYFEGDQEQTVVAIKVPHAPGASVLESDQPEEVNCEDCIHLELPEGVHWGVTTPTIVKVENGVVTCVSTRDYDRCREASEITRNRATAEQGGAAGSVPNAAATAGDQPAVTQP
jgi:hypothetical protein